MLWQLPTANAANLILTKVLPDLHRSTYLVPGESAGSGKVRRQPVRGKESNE